MRLDLYQAETARIAAEQGALLAQARVILTEGRSLTPLEQAGVLHALQVLIENAIGKAKQVLKATAKPVPVSGYDAFKALTAIGLLAQPELAQWAAIIGLRNRIVHDYMNIDMDQVMSLIAANKDQFVLDFLMKDFATG
ncbi:MAG: hypothetical protein RL459_2057 [Pseudomonadota bacterium]|jgi:uncharacterized protein YutE (UPF0331/DUF86 family)